MQQKEALVFSCRWLAKARVSQLGRHLWAIGQLNDHWCTNFLDDFSLSAQCAVGGSGIVSEFIEGQKTKMEGG
jgi:hypothetical protein